MNLPNSPPKMSVWQEWRDHPEKSWVRGVFFQVHFWVGAAVAAYIFVISVSGSMVVFRNQLSGNRSVEWLVDLHANLLTGPTGRIVNGIGALSLVLLCLTGAVIWWPGIKYWRRSLTVDWRAHAARITWDLHSALGFWFFLFVGVWALSGVYFAFPRLFDVLLLLDRGDRYTDAGLFRLTQLHFGRFGWFAQGVWVLVGLVPAVLAVTGMFICCRRVVFKKPSNPRQSA